MMNQHNRYFHRSYPIELIWLLVPLFLVFILLNLSTLREGDLWWHLNVGEDILNNHYVPETDKFSFTAFGEPFYFTRSWLGSLILYIVFSLGGLRSLVLLQALIGLVIIGIILILSLVRGAKIRNASLATTLSFLGLYSFSTARPVIFSYLCFAVVVWVLYGYRYKNQNRLWLLPIIMILWVNFNSAWITGLFLISIFIGLNIIERIYNRERFQKDISLLVGGGLTFLAILFNPIKFGILGDLFTATNHPVNQSFVSEWQPITILMPQAWPFFLILGLLIIFIRYSKQPPDWIELSLILVFMILSFRYMRILPFFYILIAPTLGLMSSEVDIKIGTRLRNGDDDHNKIPKLRKTRVNKFLIIGLFILALLSIPHLRLILVGEPEIILVDPYFPIGASEYLDQFSEKDIRLFSIAEWGGFLSWRHYPNMFVFVDGRVEQYPIPIWEDYYQIINANDGWYDLLRKYQVDYMVLSKDKLGRLISKVKEAGLTCPYDDSTSIVCNVH